MCERAASDIAAYRLRCQTPRHAQARRGRTSHAVRSGSDRSVHSSVQVPAHTLGARLVDVSSRVCALPGHVSGRRSRKVAGCNDVCLQVARAADSSGWRDLMPDVRAAAVALCGEGCLLITQKGQVGGGRAGFTNTHMHINTYKRSAQHRAYYAHAVANAAASTQRSAIRLCHTPSPNPLNLTLRTTCARTTRSACLGFLALSPMCHV